MIGLSLDITADLLMSFVSKDNGAESWTYSHHQTFSLVFREVMCGRIAQADDTETLMEEFDTRQGVEALSDLTPSYNIAPGSDLCALLVSAPGESTWVRFRWGILNSWKSQSHRVINARAETVTQKPIFKDAFSCRRTVIPVTAYYEWRPVASGKQPYCIRQEDGQPLLLAGLYTGNECVIITRSPQKEIAFIHDRMPMVVNPEMTNQYLTEPSIAYELLRAVHEVKLDAFPVTKKVGNPAFNNSECLIPIDGR